MDLQNIDKENNKRLILLGSRLRALELIYDEIIFLVSVLIMEEFSILS